MDQPYSTQTNVSTLDPVHNCTVVNQTYSTLHVVCLRGFDGGLPQDFTMEVRDAKTSFVVANTTNTRAAAFTVTGLRPGTNYLVSISSSNNKGRSEPVVIQAYTSSAPVTERKSSPGKIYSFVVKVTYFGKV